MSKKKLQENSYILFLFGVLILLIIVMALVSPYFFTWRNCRNILNQSAIYLVISIGMTFVISAGQIDLSVGAIIGFSGMVMGLLSKAGVPEVIAIALGLIGAVVIGLLNGVIISCGKINSFIVTLSTMTVLRGLILIWTNSKSIFGFGSIFTFVGSGNYCLFIGANDVALNRSGVNVKKYKAMIFSLCGLCAGIAGAIVTARLNSAEPLAGQGYEMDAIAATILGGTSMQGGKGNVIGTVIACFILNILKNGLTLLAISSHYQEILTGIILIVSVLISESKQRKKKEV